MSTVLNFLSFVRFITIEIFNFKIKFSMVRLPTNGKEYLTYSPLEHLKSSFTNISSCPFIQQIFSPTHCMQSYAIDIRIVHTWITLKLFSPKPYNPSVVTSNAIEHRLDEGCVVTDQNEHSDYLWTLLSGAGNRERRMSTS